MVWYKETNTLESINKETNNLESIKISPDNHTKTSLNNITSIKTRMKERTLRIKEDIRFIKSVEVVSQTILKVRESVVDESTIDHYKYSI